VYRDRVADLATVIGTIASLTNQMPVSLRASDWELPGHSRTGSSFRTQRHFGPDTLRSSILFPPNSTHGDLGVEQDYEILTSRAD
jgi:hypothetical protein